MNSDNNNLGTQPHRIVAESDLESLQAVWMSADTGENNLLVSVDSAVWTLLQQMVHPVSDRIYNECTTADVSPASNFDESNDQVSHDETWEAWVDQSALERVRQLRSQLRAKASAVQEKRRKVLKSVEELIAQEHEKQGKSSIQQNPLVPPLDPSFQQVCTEKAQHTQEQVDSLVQEMDQLHVKIPDVVQRFQETLATVQEEERMRHADRAVTADDVWMMGQDSQDSGDDEENKPPVQDRLLRFLLTH